MIDGHSLAAVAHAFEVEGRFQSAKPYGSGHIHDTYCVNFDHGAQVNRIILQRINTTIFTNPIAVMENIERVTRHLRSKHFDMADVGRHVLRLVPARDGRSWLADVNGQYWRAYRFIEGARTYDAVGSAQQAFEAAKAFGEFQRLLADLPAPRLHESIPDFHNTAKRFAALEHAIAADARGRCAEASADIGLSLSRRAIATALVNAELPERVTHNDTKLNNVLLDDRNGAGICVIDLDTVMPGLAAYDFGDMVRTMTCTAAEDERDLSGVTLDFELFEGVLRGYLEGEAGFLTEQECTSLVIGAKVIVYEQGIRFLTDFLAGDTYYRVSRPGQNLDRCRTQFKLLESIEQQEEAMVHLLKSLIE
ncbi:MAG: aminoglycoside phosphotransferase family protein [Terracidiphilus sp.]